MWLTKFLQKIHLWILTSYNDTFASKVTFFVLMFIALLIDKINKGIPDLAVSTKFNFEIHVFQFYKRERYIHLKLNCSQFHRVIAGLLTKKVLVTCKIPYLFQSIANNT